MAFEYTVKLIRSMDHLKEYNGNKVQGDQNLYGQKIKDGTEIRVKTVAEFEGFKCQLWAPEFHSLLIDSAIRDAKEAEILRKNLVYTHNSMNRQKELSDVPGNIENSFRVMQLAISTTASCIGAVESWANKIIQAEVNEQIEYQRLDGEKVNWGANRIEKSATLGEKVFNVIPSILGGKIIKPHVTTRKRFVDLIEDRNAVMHMKEAPKVKGKKVRRMDLSLKLIRRNALLVPKNTISMFKMVFEQANQPFPLWLIGNVGVLEAAENEVKKI
ncbi:hypothetical protein ACJJIF_06895 [Microbulbifer sp. SSSA002]|uniref:hypothetical protein n=1 Tax=Microbulbifer sp. SSSA002 TaxID=3243376 RepID=UPI00403A22C5